MCQHQAALGLEVDRVELADNWPAQWMDCSNQNWCWAPAVHRGVDQLGLRPLQWKLWSMMKYSRMWKLMNTFLLN
jgi:hypothetical protein